MKRFILFNLFLFEFYSYLFSQDVIKAKLSLVDSANVGIYRGIRFNELLNNSDQYNFLEIPPGTKLTTSILTDIQIEVYKIDTLSQRIKVRVDANNNKNLNDDKDFTIDPRN